MRNKTVRFILGHPLHAYSSSLLQWLMSTICELFLDHKLRNRSMKNTRAYREFEKAFFLSDSSLER